LRRERRTTGAEYGYPLSIIIRKKSIPLSDKKSFVLRIDNETYKALEKWAADEFRSVNGQIEWILSQKLKEAGRSKEALAKNKNNKTT
jgi:hypothetical protein